MEVAHPLVSHLDTHCDIRKKRRKHEYEHKTPRRHFLRFFLLAPLTKKRTVISSQGDPTLFSGIVLHFGGAQVLTHMAKVDTNPPRKPQRNVFGQCFSRTPHPSFLSLFSFTHTHYTFPSLLFVFFFFPPVSWHLHQGPSHSLSQKLLRVILVALEKS